MVPVYHVLVLSGSWRYNSWWHGLTFFLIHEQHEDDAIDWYWTKARSLDGACRDLRSISNQGFGSRLPVQPHRLPVERSPEPLQTYSETRMKGTWDQR